MKFPKLPKTPYLKLGWMIFCAAFLSVQLWWIVDIETDRAAAARSESRQYVALTLLAWIATAQIYRCHLWEVAKKLDDDA